MTLARYPKAVVFDLDYTLWLCWCDTHIMTPLKSVSPTTVVDRYDFQLSFYKDVESIIRELVENDVKIIAASRTATPHIAKQLLSMLHIQEGQQSSTFIVYNGARDQRQSISKQQRKI